MRRIAIALFLLLASVPAWATPAVNVDDFSDITIDGGSVEALAGPDTLPDGASFEVGFSPKGDALKIILEGIRQAEKSIQVASYSFTSKPVATALLDAHKRGVVVQVVADEKANGGKYSAVTFLANQGVPVRTNGRYAIMHHKFMVIDGAHVQTGSFNYSASAAARNAENALMLRNVPGLAAEYSREWERLWNEGADVAPRY